MGVIIKKIQLSNWFGYRGEYDENTFEFSNGVNIIVATNDVGKSKLHSAFRWIIDDKVILKNIETNKHEIVTVNNSNIDEVLNQFVQTTLSNNENTTLGVKITYEVIKTKDDVDDVKLRILTKEIQCRKDIDTIKIVETKLKVDKIERGNVRTASNESFEDCIKQLMRNNLKDYFLVQGENVENLTALKGSKLADTINLLVELNILDKKCNISENLSKSLKSLKDDYQKRDYKHNTNVAENIRDKQRLEDEIEVLENTIIPEIEQLIIENEKIINEYSTQANDAKTRKDLKDKVEKFNTDIARKDGGLRTQYKSFVENCVNGKFWISSLTDNTNEKENLLNSSLRIREYVANRRAELDERLDKNEQKMLSALERDQPSPIILDQMIDDSQCYVCSQSLNDKSKKYIREKLIPYFKRELNHDDNELKILDEVHDFIKMSQSFLNNFSSTDSSSVNDIKKEIINTEKEVYEIKKNLEEFIKINGSVDDDENDVITLNTYNNAYKNCLKFEKQRDDKKIEFNNLKDKLSKIKINTINENKSKEFIKTEDIHSFSVRLFNYLVNLKNEEYIAFCKKLEEVANEKWKAFTKCNIGLYNQNIKVRFSINPAKKPEFEIKVVDRFDNDTNQGGGASQAIRQLSVIFGLIEIAGGNVNYPFIADAPTSNATLALSEEFFKYQLDNAQNQNILITKELWDDRTNDLNSSGSLILEKVEQNSKARLITIKNGDNKNKKITIIR